MSIYQNNQYVNPCMLSNAMGTQEAMHPGGAAYSQAPIYPGGMTYPQAPMPPGGASYSQVPMPSGGMTYPQGPMPTRGIPSSQVFMRQSGMPIQTPMEPFVSTPPVQEPSVPKTKEIERRTSKEVNEPQPQREADIITAPPFFEKMSYKVWENQQNLALYQSKIAIKDQSHLQAIESEAVLRECISEKRAERKRNQYQKVEILQNGEVISRTENLLIGGEPRMVINLKKPRIYVLKSISGEEGYFRLEFEVEEKRCTVYLQAMKCGESRYLLKKIQAAGGVFRTNKRNERYEYVAGLWAALLEADVPVIEIPEIYGWNQGSDGQFRFVEEGEVLWNDVKKAAC